MTNKEAINILLLIANTLIEQYAPKEDRETYFNAIDKAVKALEK